MKLKQIFVGMSGVALISVPVLSYAGTTLNGAGATFPFPFYSRVFSDYSKVSDTRVNYASVGSGAGVRQFVAGTVDFGASDEPISSKEAAKVKRGVVQIPMVGGTIAIAYNKPGCSLKLTQKQTVDIFSGRIKDWKQVGCAAVTVLEPPLLSLTLWMPLGDGLLVLVSPSSGLLVSVVKATKVLLETFVKLQAQLVM